MAIIEEAEPHIDRHVGLRERLGIVRVIKVDGDVYFQCQFCKRHDNTRYHSERDHLEHVRVCKRAHRILQKLDHTDPKKMGRAVKRFNAIYEQITDRNFLRSHANESRASGIGEFASNCATFLGNHVQGMLEHGLVQYKSNAVRQYLNSLRTLHGVYITQAIFASPDADFISAINDLLLILQACLDSHSKYSEARSHSEYSIDFFCIMIWEGLKKAFKQESRPLQLSPMMLKQIFAIRRFHSLFKDRRNLIRYDNMIMNLLLGSDTSTIGTQVETITNVFHDEWRDVLDFDKIYWQDLCLYDIYYDPYASVVCTNMHGSDSQSYPLWRRTLRLTLALQLLRVHIDKVVVHEESPSWMPPNFGIISYISPDLKAINYNQEEIRCGIQDMMHKFLSAVNRYLHRDYGFLVEVFGDIIQANSVLDGLNGNSKAWDSTMSRWLMLDTPDIQHTENSIPPMQKYWIALQGFRNLSANEEFRQRCRAILDDRMVRKRFAQWLSVPNLEKCRLRWEDIDPDNDWCNGFWCASTPPKGVDLKYIVYCANHRHWRIVREEFRQKVDFEKLYSRRLPQRYYYDNLDSSTYCHSTEFSATNDWRIYLQWEEREVLIKHMIRQNLRRTRPEIMNSANIISQDEPDNRTEDSVSDANVDAANDEIIHTSEESRYPGRSPDSSSDIYPSYDAIYIHQ